MSFMPQDPSLGGPPPGPGAPPPGGAPGPAPSLLPFPTTQPGPTMQLMAPYLQQQAIDLATFKQEQAQNAMGILMQAMQEMPNPAAEAAQVTPEQPMQSSQGAGPTDTLALAGPSANAGGQGY
jgi:hypothetical protein